MFKTLTSKIFHDISKDTFLDPRRCIGNYHYYIIRKSILDFVCSNSGFLSGKLVDLGCGSSPYKQLLKKRGCKIKSYTAIDIENNPYRIACHQNLVWNGREIPLPDSSVDSILMTEVIEHLPDHIFVLNEVYRILKPKGVLVATVPFLYPLHEKPWDFRRLTPFEIERISTEIGFSECKITRFGGWDLSFAQMIGLWLTCRPMNAKLRFILMLFFYPLYCYLLEADKMLLAKSEKLEQDFFVGLGVVLRR